MQLILNNMKRLLLIIIIVTNYLPAFSITQTDSIFQAKDSLTPKYWTSKKTVGLLLTQTSFVNWNAGGANSIAGILSADVDYNYKKGRLFWNNKFKGRYGLNKKEGTKLRKTNDVFEISSKFGYRKSDDSEWYNSARFNFRTQFANGYKYPDRDTSISQFFAPAYLFLGVGSQYTSKTRKLKLYISPLTNKTTIVANQRLANRGSFGVQKAVYEGTGDDRKLVKEGKNSKVEFGSLFSGEWEHKVMENILMKNKLGMYSDYLNKFGNIDFDWELKFNLVVNKYVKANVGTHILYDDDVKDKEDDKPKIQLKQILGIGLTYTFL